jgi:predicted nucleic acid-binding protein
VTPPCTARTERYVGDRLQNKLTTYDAADLELAVRRSLPLSTFDSALEKAARAVGVTIYMAPQSPTKP